MPRTTFRDCDELAQALRSVAGRFVPTGRPRADWWLQTTSIGEIVIEQCQTGAPYAFVGEGKDSVVTLGAPITNPARIRIDGRALTERAFVLVNERQPFAACSTHPARLACVMIPTSHPRLPAELAALRLAPSRRRRDASLQADAQDALAARALLMRLLANDAEGRELDEASARAAEEELLYVFSCVLDAAAQAQVSSPGRPRYLRRRVLTRALQVMESRRGEPLFVQDLCRATQVSERTLRNIFREYFGVGPVRLLKIIRLHEVRAALLQADCREESVWKIASRFGVWDVSLFAREYKALYDELPNQTLRAPPRARLSSPAWNVTWTRYAARKLAQASAPAFADPPT